MPFIVAFEVAAPEMFATAAGAEFGTAAAFDALGAEALGAGALGLEGLGAGAGLFGEFGGSLAGQALGGAPLGEAITEGILSGGAGAGGAGINEALLAQQQASALEAANSGLQAVNTSGGPSTWNEVFNQGQNIADAAKDLGQVAETSTDATRELIQNQGIDKAAQYPLGSSAERQALYGNTEGAYGLEGYDNRFMPLEQPTGLQAGFEKALNYVKENPFSAASMGYSAMKLLGGDKKQGEAPAEYNGPLSRYKMSPNFQGRQANPQDFQYTPQQYNYAEGGIASFKAGGDPGAKLAMDYYESMQRQQAKDMPSTKSDPGIYYDLDPDTRYLDPMTAAQVRMAKLNKRANVQAQNMKRPMGLGQINLAPPGAKAQESGGTTDAAHGGIMHSSLGGYAAGGNPRLLKGPGDGMSDNIPATISGKQPARLADGEFVVPADVVSHLGNGSTEAGAKVLHAMMTKVRKERTGNPKQGKQINPRKFVPT